MKYQLYILYLLVPLAVCDLIGCSKGLSQVPADVSAGPVAVQITPVKVRSIRVLLQAPGTFVSAQGASANLASPNSGKIKSVFVKEGDRVSQGQLLATLDLSVVNAQTAGANAAAQQAEALARQAQLSSQAASVGLQLSIKTAQATLDEAKAQGTSDIAAAQVNLQQATQELLKIRAGARPQELELAHQAVITANADLEKAQKDFARSQELVRAGFASQKELEAASAAEKVAQANLTTAEQSESLVKAGSRQEDRTAAEQRVAGAKAELAAAKALAQQRIIQATTGLNQAKAGQTTVDAQRQVAQAAAAGLAQKQAEAASAQATAKMAEIRAPYGGKITRRFLNPGDLADPTTPVLQLSSSASTDFAAKASAADAQKVTAGMTAIITADGGKTYNGTVVSVSPADATTDLATIRIISNSQELAGSGGTSSIVLRTDSNATAVLNTAIVERDGLTYAFIANNGVAHQVTVRIGGVDGNYTEILSGLKAGDNVVELGQYELSDGSKIIPQPAQGTASNP